MDPVILAEKLEALRRCTERIEARRADTPEALRADVDRQGILSLNLTRAVQHCVDTASTYWRIPISLRRRPWVRHSTCWRKKA